MSEASIHKFADEVIDLALALNQKEIINLAVDHGLIVPRGIACKEGRPCNCMFMCDKERGYERVYVPPRVVNETYIPSFNNFVDYKKEQHHRMVRQARLLEKLTNDLPRILILAVALIGLVLLLPGEF